MNRVLTRHDIGNRFADGLSCAHLGRNLGELFQENLPVLLALDGLALLLRESMMFGGWGYLLKERSIKSAIRSVHRHLRRGGLFIVEFWNVGGVRGPGYRSWDSIEGEMGLIRWSESNPDQYTKRLVITMNHLVYSKHRVLDRFSERHVLRLYRPSEMRKLLVDNGFRVIGIFRCYPRRGLVKAGPGDFNVVAVAVAR